MSYTHVPILLLKGSIPINLVMCYVYIKPRVCFGVSQRGLMFDNRLELGGAVGSINRYYPKEDPLNTTSADKEVILKKLTGNDFFLT